MVLIVKHGPRAGSRECEEGACHGLGEGEAVVRFLTVANSAQGSGSCHGL